MGFGTILKFITGVYVALLVLIVYNLTRPIVCDPRTQKCVHPAFASDENFDLLVYVSEFENLGPAPRFPSIEEQQCEDVSSGGSDSSSNRGNDNECISNMRPRVGEDLQLIWSVKNVSFASSETLTSVVNVSSLPYSSFRNNGTLFAHVFITRPNMPPSASKTVHQSYLVAPLTVYMPPVVRNRTMLIEDLSATASSTSTTKQVANMLAASVGSALILSASYFLHHPRYGGWSYVVLATTTCLVFAYTILIRMKQGQMFFESAAAVVATKTTTTNTTSVHTLFAPLKPVTLPSVTHWKGSLNLDLVTEFSDIGLNSQSYPDLVSLLSKHCYVANNTYSLLFSNEELSLVRRYFTPVSQKFPTQAELEISFHPRSMFMYRGLHIMESQFKENIRMGFFTEHDLDDLRLFFSVQKLWVLILTYVISMLHMLFDFLAFKSDVGFYRARKDFSGLSSRVVISSFMCSLIVYLYLVDNELTSSLILISTGVGCLIELWKIKRILKVEIQSEWPYVSNAIASANEQKTDRFDVVAMGYLGMILYPLVLGMAIWSLIYYPQKSWWSWAIGSLAYGVYVFGFIMMTPQLFINYQLKSVAHMPWRVLMYKAFNTFIDDVFSFVIAMPMAHRIACLRDDLVFFVYLYQRWCFPVDKSRPNEYGMVYENENNTDPASTANLSSELVTSSPTQSAGGDLRQRHVVADTTS